MSFSDLTPSKQWAALKYKGGKFAEVWFKPEGDPCALMFRIPRESFQLAGLDKDLSMANLLKAVALAPDQVESWRHGDGSQAGMNGGNPDATSVLPAPPPHAAHLEVHVRLKPPAQDVVCGAAESPAPQWEEFEARWKTTVGIEASIDSVRMSMESLMAEVEGSLKKSLTVEEKVNAARADISQWTKEKKRARDAVPKMRDFIHRSVWSMGTPERKRLGVLYTNNIQPHVPFPQMTQVLQELEALQKARQILLAQGNTVYQESRAISASVQGALRTLQHNAAMNAKRKRDGGKGGKFFKEVRGMTGAG